MQILITGASGVVGADLCKIFLKNTKYLQCIDQKTTLSKFKKSKYKMDKT